MIVSLVIQGWNVTLFAITPNPPLIATYLCHLHSHGHTKLHGKLAQDENVTHTHVTKTPLQIIPETLSLLIILCNCKNCQTLGLFIWVQIPINLLRALLNLLH